MSAKNNTPYFLTVIYMLIAYAAGPLSAATLQGIVTYQDSTPAPGTIVYAIGSRQRLIINNNTIMSADHIPRAITDVDGAFRITGINWDSPALFARDMLDQAACLGTLDPNGPLELVLSEAADVSATCLQGRDPLKGNQQIIGGLLTGTRAFRYSLSRITDKNGRTHFRNLVPGEYRFEIRQDESPRWTCSKKC